MTMGTGRILDSSVFCAIIYKLYISGVNGSNVKESDSDEEMDAEEAAGPSHSDAYEAFQTAMNWLERTPFRKIPKINGHEIDLYLLYVLVTAHGGWVKTPPKIAFDSTGLVVANGQ
uniref:ARID domain-containing protein n=1 Tax=Timema douglasi TaxID=61478 RepID=A0A7R8ZE73_TIMDO|nr:unnamed protein product [Timema douglasi]